MRRKKSKKNSNYKLKRIRQILKLTNKGYASTWSHKVTSFPVFTLKRASSSGCPRGIEETNSHWAPWMCQALPVFFSGVRLLFKEGRNWGSETGELPFKKKITWPEKGSAELPSQHFTPDGHSYLCASCTCLCLDCEHWFPWIVCTLWHSTKE